MNKFMWWDAFPMPLWNAANEGAGGTGEEGGEGGSEGEGGEATPHWLDGVDGIEDADRDFVGQRSQSDLIKYAKQQRDAASRRSEDVQKVEGMFKLPEPDATPEAFKEHFDMYKPESTAEYMAVGGYEEGNITPSDELDMEAAHAAGMHKEQFKAFSDTRREGMEAANKATADTIAKELKDEWGADYERNVQILDRGMKAMDPSGEFATALSSMGGAFTAKIGKAIMKYALQEGNAMREGGPINEGDPSTGQTLEQERADLEAIQIDGRALTSSQTARMKILNDKIAEGKANEPA